MSASATRTLRGTVILRNIPRTALNSDVRRMLESYRIENVKGVHLDYHRFMPVGKAYVTFTQPAFAQPSYLRLRAAQLSGIPLDVTTTSDDVFRRMRGSKGREEAIARGAFAGNGADAGVSERGKNVVVWGLPGRMSTDQLRNYLRGLRLVNTEDGKEDILKLEFPGRTTITSRHYVRTVSVSEAHRLVRRLHMSSMDQGGRQYIVRARVIY